MPKIDRRSVTMTWSGVACMLLAAPASCQVQEESLGVPESDAARRDVSRPWRELFDGRSLRGWTATSFGGEGKVGVRDGTLRMEIGAPLTGITWAGQGALPTLNYEIQVEACRVEGHDFFCALTFPYESTHATLVVGGWGGGVVGISSLAGKDASQNETTKVLSFEHDRWYDIKLSVRRGRLQAWLDGLRVVDCYLENRAVSTRPEVRLSRPLGIASYETTAEIRKVRLRSLPPDEPLADSAEPAP